MPGFPPRQQASTLRVRCGKACIVPYLPYMFMSYLYLSTDQTLSIINCPTVDCNAPTPRVHSDSLVKGPMIPALLGPGWWFPNTRGLRPCLTCGG